MASTSLEIVISANDRFSAKADRIIGKLHGIGTSAGRVGKGVGELGVGLARVGAVGFTALAGGLAAASKTAIDFEDSFAGVRKTVEGTKPELDGLYTDLRALAQRIPVKFTDLAGIAQEAGALGVAREDVVKFTDVVSRLSAATVGLTPDAAAEAFGKLGNVLHQHGADYERMGSVLVALGNAAASSEGDIIEVAKRFGAAGHAAGLSAAQVLGLSSAVASLGVEPEAAGGALSRLFNNLTTNLAAGNDKAKAFAKSLGETVGGVKKAFDTNSLGVFQDFLKVLSGLDKYGQASLLKSVGITNSRDVNAIRLLSQNYGEVARQTDLASKAYKENGELAAVSAKRFDTLKNKLALVKNTILDAAVSIAEGFNPALGRLADKLGTFVSSHKNDLVAFGKDIGKFLDGIDWSKVAAGAQTFVDLMKTLLGVVQKIPPEVTAAVLAFAGLNKISGGLLGKGITDIAGGLAGIVTRTIGAALPGKLGGLVGQLGAQPVFVTNWPLGGFGGGGVPGVSGKVGSIASAVGKVFLIGAAAGAFFELKNILDTQSAANREQEKGLATQTSSFTGGATLADLKKSLEGIKTYEREQLDHGLTPEALAYDLNIDGVRDAIHHEEQTLQDAIDNASQTRGLTDRGDEQLIGAMRKVAGLTDRADEQIGYLTTTVKTGLAKLPPVLQKLADREMAKADKILRSNESVGRKVHDLQAIERDLKDHKLPAQARLIQNRIDGVRAAELATKAAIVAKDWSVTIHNAVTAAVTIRDIINGTSLVSHYGNATTHSTGKFQS